MCGGPPLGEGEEEKGLRQNHGWQNDEDSDGFRVHDSATHDSAYSASFPEPDAGGGVPSSHSSFVIGQPLRAGIAVPDGYAKTEDMLPAKPVVAASRW